MLLNRRGSQETVLSSFRAVRRAVISRNRGGVFASVNVVRDPAQLSGKTTTAVSRLMMMMMMMMMMMK